LVVVTCVWVGRVAMDVCVDLVLWNERCIVSRRRERPFERVDVCDGMGSRTSCCVRGRQEYNDGVGKWFLVDDCEWARDMRDDAR
jgi:hypothetical protein